MQAWLNGCPADSVGLGNRGLAYGDGLFETIAVRGGRPLLFERHLARLADGCQRLSIPLDISLVRQELQAYAAAMGEGVAKLVVTRGDSPRGYGFEPDAEPYRILQAGPLPAWPESHAREGVQLFACRTRLAEQPLLAGIKHLNRLEQVLARAEWQGQSGYAEGLMCDAWGRPIEGVFSNLFLVREGRLLTADLSRCGVAGVMRAELLTQAVERGITCDVRDLEPDDLAHAEEVFMCNSVYGVWPVVAFESLRWSVGTLTLTLQSFAHALLDA